MLFIVGLISCALFLILQIIAIVTISKVLKSKTLMESQKALIRGIILVSVFFALSVVLSIFDSNKTVFLFRFLPALLAAVFGVVSFNRYINKKRQEETHTKEIEAEALKLAEINNITDETYLRAKNLLPLGNDFLILTANAIRKKASRQEVYDFVLDKMIDEAFADGGILLIVDGDDEVIKVKSQKGIFPPPYKLPADVPLKQNRVEMSIRYAQFEFEGNIFANVAATGKPLLIADATNDNRIFSNGDEFFLKAQTYMFLPLISGDQVIGMVALSRSIGSPCFTASDVEICQILSDYSSTSLHIADSLDEEAEKDLITNEKELAAKLQNLLLPKKLPKISGIDAYPYFQPASGICSDYYDVIVPSTDKVFFVMLDIAGKSIQASVIMIMIRTLLHLTTNTNQATDKIIDWINKGVTKKIDIDHFASVALVQYNPKMKKLYYSGAGNTSISIFHAKDKKFERIKQTTDAIGVDSNSKYKIAESSLDSGDILMLYSDGAIEALNRNGESFAIPRLYETVGLNAEKSAKELSMLLKKQYDDFTAGVQDHDDRSVLLIKAK